MKNAPVSIPLKMNCSLKNLRGNVVNCKKVNELEKKVMNRTTRAAWDTTENGAICFSAV